MRVNYRVCLGKSKAEVERGTWHYREEEANFQRGKEDESLELVTCESRCERWVERTLEARAEVGVGSQDLQKGVSQTTVGTMSRFGGKAGQFVQSLTVILKNLTCVPQEATKWHDQYFYRQTRSMGGFPPPSSLLMFLFPSPAINSLKVQLGNFMICLHFDSTTKTMSMWCLFRALHPARAGERAHRCGLSLRSEAMNADCTCVKRRRSFILNLGASPERGLGREMNGIICIILGKCDE